MKHILFFLTFLPLFVFAHRDDPREPRVAPYAGVLTVKTIIFLTLPKENHKLDTCIEETELYNRDGLLIRHNFLMDLEKNPWYDYTETFSYSARDAWTQQVYKRGVRTDSICVNGSWADWYSFQEGQPHVLHEYRGDSLQEKVINGSDTVFRAKKVNKDVNSDEFWDSDHAGSFARKAVTTDKDGAEAVTYYGVNDEKLAGYVEHRISGGHVTQIDYYNYGVKRFDFKRLTYSEKLEMTFFLEKSKKGKWSYQVLYTYNDKGQLIEERWVDPDPKRNQVVKKYAYEFY